MKRKRTGPDTCCLECSKLAACRQTYAKTRNPCNALARNDACCGATKECGGCLVCPSFEGATSNDPRQTRLFQS